MKQCSNCNVFQPLENFYNDSSNRHKDKKYAKCKSCMKSLIVTYNQDITLKSKVCRTCHKELEISSFHKHKFSKDGFNSQCKFCTTAYNRNFYKQGKCNIKAKVETKLCIKCNNIKVNTDFKTNARSKDNLMSICNDCWPKKQYTREQSRACSKRWFDTHPEYRKEKWRRQGKKINRRIRNSINRRIRTALKKFNLNKSTFSVEYLGCSVEYLKIWLEYQFQDGMNWDNFGEWHIDHVNPCSAYDLSKEEEQYKCFNWTNLQPLWAKDNIMKSDKINKMKIEKHINLKIKFETEFPLPTNACE